MTESSHHGSAEPDAAPHAPRSTSDDTVVKCVGLTKIFRDFWMRHRVRAVDHIDLEVHRGEVFGLLGPNGSGKSTTIKLALGLLHPSAGRVFVFGRRPEEVAIKKRIGYLPEESYLYRFLNARETLDYYGRLFFQSRSQRQKRIDMLLEMVGLTAVQRRPVGEYSKGMQRRIGLAQALINDPDLLILDEPTTGLDPIGTRQIKDLIFELAQRGKTVLLCSHLLADVEDVCHRVAIMFGGKVRKEGTVDELLIQADSTMIQTAILDVATIQQIEQVLERVGKHIEKVEQPRQRLEQLFLDIVHEALAEGAATSGAVAGGRMASFLIAGDDQSVELRGAHLPESGAELVDRLISPSADSQPAPAKATPAADHEAIDRLAGSDDGDTAASNSSDAARVDSDAADEKVDQAMLDDLLKKSARDDGDSAPKAP
ncbi:MAG: ABC transporter ATP-binding protein [Vicinamibacterales bacterium]|jgi:ABC-2 type transport system ATP-binding protein|nr:ABC transporter ATP-binding protein [Vicinamibacterales bacterium]